MLGLLYKVAWEIAPKPIQSIFSLRPATLEQQGFLGSASRHSKQIMDPVAFNHPVMIKRSVFGLIRVFNSLPQNVVNAGSVQIFQKMLQGRAKDLARNGQSKWELMYHHVD